MKKIVFTISILLSVILIFSACSKEEKTVLSIEGQSSITMKVGAKHSLKLEQNVDDVEWISENDAIATVSPEGVVTAVGSGITVVSARTENSHAHIGIVVDGNSSYVDKKGNVIEVFDGVSDITDITVGVKGGGKDDVTVNKGDKLQLVAYTTPSNSKDEIVWRTENADIAKVDENGKLTVIGTGKTSVKAYAPNGEYGEITIRVK